MTCWDWSLSVCDRELCEWRQISWGDSSVLSIDCFTSSHSLHMILPVETQFINEVISDMKLINWLCLGALLLRRYSNRKMDSNGSSSVANVTLSKKLSMLGLMDPYADYALGFWLNGVAVTVIGLMGIFGNLASIHVLSRKQMRSSVNFILMALATSDLLLIVTSILIFALTTVYPYTGYLIDYYFKAFPIITLAAFPLASICQTVSVYMTFLISFERYIAVCRPLRAKSFCTRRRAKLLIFMFVLFSVVYNLPRFFETSLNKGHDEDYGDFYFIRASSIRRNPLYIQIYINLSYFILMNLIPLAGIIFFNFMIYRQVRIVNRMRVKLTRKERQDIKLTTMLFCVVIVFLSCNILAVVNNILESFFGIWHDRVTKLSNFLVTFNSSVNFIIYVVLVKKFRLIFIRQFKSLLRLSDSKERQHGKFSKTISMSESEQTTNETLWAYKLEIKLEVGNF